MEQRKQNGVIRNERLIACWKAVGKGAGHVGGTALMIAPNQYRIYITISYILQWALLGCYSLSESVGITAKSTATGYNIQR